MRQAKSYNKGVVTQWNLVHVVLATIRETKPERWTASFDACNLDPRTRTSFSEWCQKIEPHLQTGQLFKAEAVEEDLFLLLPPFWHGMVPAERRDVIDTITKEGFSPAVLRKLRTEFKIESKDWTNVLTCCNVCKNKPEHLGRVAPGSELVAAAKDQPDDVKASLEDTKDVNDGLSCFRWTGKHKLEPANTPKENLKILDHMCGFRNVLCPADKNDEVAPSSCLGHQRSLSSVQCRLFRSIQQQRGLGSCVGTALVLPQVLG